jgi:hypothetical protein
VTQQVFRLLVIGSIVAATPLDGFAQRLDLTVFLGQAFPVYDDRLAFTPSLPVFPRVAVRETGPLEISTDGGAVFGGAVAVEFGIVAIEGRLDATDVDFAVNGTRYDLVATAPVTVQIGSITVGSGGFTADRMNLWSLNVRLRTPGPVALVASGGLSYLPGITIEGQVPVTVDAAGVLSPATVNANLRLVATPGDADHRWGLNGGVGLRVGGDHLAFLAEARAFYFQEFELRFTAPDGPDLLNAVLGSIDPVRFEPIIVNAQAGVVFKF